MTKETAIAAIKDFIKLYDNLLAVRVVPAEVLDILIEAINTVLPLIEEGEHRCKICECLHNIRVFEYYCPKCGTKMSEVENNGT